MEDSEESIAESNSSSETTNPNLQFTDKLYQEVSKNGNVLLSPISVEVLLAMTYQGAAGETAEKFATILGVPNQQAAANKYKCVVEKLNGKTNPTLDIANKIFIMKDFPLKNTFENVIEESFMAKFEPIDFTDNKKASEDINQWAEEKTKNKIRNLISPDVLDDSVRLVLLNALYLKSNWEKPFLEVDTTMQPFYISEEEAVDCEMMFVASSFKYCSYHEQLGAKVLELPYKNKDVSMIIILPSYYEDFATMETKLVKTELSKLTQDEDMQPSEVEVFLPKFKIEATVDVKPLLEKMGLETIFAPNTADLSGISESSESLYVSHFLQKTFIAVDENDGTEAAADTESTESKAHFTVDRPFMFVLQIKGGDSNTVLLVGKVINPTW